MPRTSMCDIYTPWLLVLYIRSRPIPGICSYRQQHKNIDSSSHRRRLFSHAKCTYGSTKFPTALCSYVYLHVRLVLTTGESPYTDGHRLHIAWYTNGHLRRNTSRRYRKEVTEGHRGHNASRRHTDWQAGQAVTPSRCHSGCADGCPRHIHGRRHISLTVGPHSCCAEGYPRHRIWPSAQLMHLFIFTLFLVQR
jgi:hypothetical protein